MRKLVKIGAGATSASWGRGEWTPLVIEGMESDDEESAKKGEDTGSSAFRTLWKGRSIEN